MEFFDRYFHTPPPIVTKHELGLPFLPRNLRIKFGANLSTIFLVIVVTDKHRDRQTHKPTPVKTFPRFRGDNYTGKILQDIHGQHGYIVSAAVHLSTVDIQVAVSHAV